MYGTGELSCDRSAIATEVPPTEAAFWSQSISTPTYSVPMPSSPSEMTAAALRVTEPETE